MKCLAVALLAVGLAAPVLAGDAPALIPRPSQMELRAGQFQLGSATRILADESAAPTARYLAARLQPATGFPLPVSISAKTTPGQRTIVLSTADAGPELGAEGYLLSVTAEGVVIHAAKPAGLFYGVQSLLQLLPPDIYSKKPATGVNWIVPGCEVKDVPRFPWRGMMLDVSRHFFNKEEVKQVLDAMALHKLNTFHWHLVDDHGWRVQIDKYPLLTQVGAWRSGVGFGIDPKESIAYGPDGRYGGFYTKADIRELVAYAQARHITIVPEIEMPGHSIAALAAYPQLSCSGSPYSTDVAAGVHAGVYCAGKDEPFEFLQNVLTEVFELFPGQYVHIGGDEVPKENWKACPRCQARMKAENLKNEHELQSYFIRRIEKFFKAQGRNLIGWSEIREGGLAQNAAVMDWIGGAVEAASDGHDVVMSPTTHCYLDYGQSPDRASEPRGIGGYLPLSQVYSFEPIPANLAAQHHRRILGAQGNVWTEYIASLRHAEYMAFPRLSALAEVTWSPKETRDYAYFLNRWTMHRRRLDQLGIAYRQETSVKIGEWKPSQINTQGVTLEWEVTTNVTAAGKQRVSLAYTQGAHGIRIEWAALLEAGQEVARDTHAGFAGGRPRNPVYVLELPARKAGARYVLRAQVAGDGGTDSAGSVMWSLPAKSEKP